MDKTLIYTASWHFDSIKLHKDYPIKDLSNQRKKLEEKSNWKPMSMALKKVNGKKVLHVNVSEKLGFRHFAKIFDKLEQNKSKLGHDFILYMPKTTYIDKKDIMCLLEDTSVDIKVEIR